MILKRIYIASVVFCNENSELRLITVSAIWSRYVIVFGRFTCHIWPRLAQQSDAIGFGYFRRQSAS
jgi:hypothetical protein